MTSNLVMRVKHVRNEQRLIIPQRARNMKNINATERSSFHKTFHKENHHDEKYNFKHKVINNFYFIYWIVR